MDSGDKNVNIKPRIIIVDENDTIIGHKNRDVVKQDDIYRVSALWITNSNAKILLAQRSLNKSHDPGRWGPAVAGTVDEGENYKINILKEAEEEIGLRGVKPQIGPKIRISGEHNYFCQWYLLEIDKPIDELIVDRREVEQVKWFLKKGLLKEIQDHPDKFLKNMKQWIGLFCQ